MTIPIMKLPEQLPVFPLTGVLLLPGTVLPLHIFEPRYRNMVEDALEADKVFGMIQPFTPQQDNRPLPGAEKVAPDLYKVGCAGYIDSCQELPLNRGYRRVKALYQDFADGTLGEGWHCERETVLRALADYGRVHGLEVKTEQAKRFSDLELVNLLGVSLPFHPAEKQAL